MLTTRTLCTALLVVLPACPEAEPTAPTTPDVVVDTTADAIVDTLEPVEVPTDPGSVRFDRAGAGFADFPFPSDLRLTAAGTPDLSTFAPDSDVDLLNMAIDEVHKGVPGFGPLSSVYVGFRDPVDASTLPATVEASLANDASAFLIDITPDSPAYGDRIPVTFSYSGEGGGYWSDQVVAFHPLYQLPPRPGTTYAAVITSAVTGPNGAALTAPAVVAQLPGLIGRTDDPLVTLMAPLPDVLQTAGVAWSDVVAVTIYTTADPMADLRAFADFMRDEMPAPTVKDLQLVETLSNCDVYEGTWTSEELLSGTSPYMTFGEGKLTVDARNPVDLRMAISVPSGDPPAEGWPVVMYNHGLGENYRGFVTVAAEPMAEHGVAVIGIDPPLQGERNPTTQDDRDLIVALAVNNIIAGREILRQGVLDNIALARLITEADFGPDIAFDPTRIAFAGHSEGAQIGALLLPLEPVIGAGLLSEGGGGGAITMLELNLDGTDIAGLVGLALGIDDKVETLDLGHPITSAVIQPLLDPADPLHSARHIFLEPPAGGRAHSFVMLEGFQDPLTPPPSMEALASAAGLSIAEPVGREIEGLNLQSIEATPLPASGNLPNGVTGGLIQLPNVGHYAIYFNHPVRKQIFDYLGSSFGDGPPTLSPR